MALRQLQGDDTGTKLQIVAVNQDSLIDRDAIYFGAIRTFEVLQDKVAAIVRNTRMMPRNFAVIESQIAANTPSDYHFLV